MSNFVTNHGAVADGVATTATLTISSGSKNLASSTSLWASGDVGKTIRIDGAGSSGAALVSTIATFTNATHVVLADNAGTALSASSRRICFGTANDAAVTSFNSANVGVAGVLTVPAGIYVFAGNPNGPILGIGATSIDVTATGATFCGLLWYGGGGVIQNDNTTSALTRTTYAYESQTTCLTVAQAARFTVGTRAILGSLDMQGAGSYPPNLFFWDYVRITGADAGTGIVTFDRPVKYTHKSTYPIYDAGGPSNASCGGPATLYSLAPTSDMTVTLRGLTFWTDGAGANAQGVNVYARTTDLIDCITDQAGPVISVSERTTYLRPNFPLYSMEVDKMTDLVEIISAVDMHKMFMQSSSPLNLHVSGGFFSDSLQNGGRNVIVQGTTFGAGVGVGVSGYGRTDSWTSDDCVIPDISLAGGVGEDDVQSLFTLLPGGVLSYPLASGPKHWAVPGTWMFFAGSSETEGMPFRVTDVRVNGSNVEILTSGLGDVWPSLALTGGHLNLRQLPTRRFKFTNCTGCAEAVDMSGYPAGTLYRAYSKRTYNPASWATGVPFQLPSFQTWGTVTSVTLNVTTAYTGAQSTCILSAPLRNAGSQINMKVAGSRTINSDGSVTGAQSGDSFTFWSPMFYWWGTTWNGPYLETNISGDNSNTWPTVVITIVHSQGIPNDVFPLRLRLHS